MSGEFIGPLNPAAQQRCEQAARMDRIAAISEPVALIVQRRLASIAELNQAAALLLLTGDVDTAQTLAASAIAESPRPAGVSELQPAALPGLLRLRTTLRQPCSPVPRLRDRVAPLRQITDAGRWKISNALRGEIFHFSDHKDHRGPLASRRVRPDQPPAAR